MNSARRRTSKAILAAIAMLFVGQCLAVSASNDSVSSGGASLGWSQSSGASAADKTSGGLKAWSEPSAPKAAFASYAPSSQKPTLIVAKLDGLALIGRKVDKVVVDKSSRRLYLFENGTAFREYPIALGKNPGPKQEEGDGRTPEGRYVLDWRKSNSKFYRAIHVSYPNEQDVARAQAADRDPGSYIMIHGSPDWVPSSEWADQWLNQENWTDGCIALSNDKMDEIWKLVKDGTPIEILP